MATKTQLAELQRIATELQDHPARLLKGLRYIGDHLGIWYTGTAQSRAEYPPGIPLVAREPLVDWDRGIEFKPALCLPDGTGALPAVRAMRDPQAGLLTTLGGPNTFRERRQLGLEVVGGVALIEEYLDYQHGSHAILTINAQRTALGIHQRVLDNLRRLPADTIIGAVDFLGTDDGDTDTFRYPMPDEAGHAMSTQRQIRLASVAVPAGAVLDMISVTPMVIGTYAPLPRVQ